MLAFADTQRAAIAELCRRFHLERLELFGSATGPISIRRGATSIFVSQISSGL
jgi:hypothetical protein